MNKIIKIFILYCLPILTIQSCGKTCHSKPANDPDTNNNSQAKQTDQQNFSSITEAMCKKTKDYLIGTMGVSTVSFFEQTIQEIRNGNPAAVNKQNTDPRECNYTLLNYALYSDNEELFKELLKLSPDLTQKDTFGMTILLDAIDRRAVNFVKMILGQPDLATFINEPDPEDNNPVAYAKIKKFFTTIPEERNDFKAIIKALKAKEAV